jgi:hypothetical protein
MRKHKRYALDLPVAVLEQTGQGGGRVFLLRTADVSAGGALFHAQRGLPAGAEVRLIFFLHVDPRKAMIDRRYSFRGTVVRSEPGRFAVTFGREMRAAGTAAIRGAEPGAPCGVSPRPDGEQG